MLGVFGDLGFGDDANAATRRLPRRTGTGEASRAARHPGSNLLGTLRNLELAQVAKDIVAETSLKHRPVADGQRAWPVSTSVPQRGSQLDRHSSGSAKVLGGLVRLRLLRAHAADDR